MVFGVFIDVPLIVGGFLLMFRYRRQIANKVAKTNLHPFLLYMLISVPLIIFEEHIDCMPAWCGRVLIPPTLPFILVEIFVLGLLALRLHATNVRRVTLLFSIFGVFWEILVGGLVGAPLLIIAILAPYVGVGYAFISLLPLTILLEAKPRSTRSEAHDTSSAPGPDTLERAPITALNWFSPEILKYSLVRPGFCPNSFL